MPTPLRSIRVPDSVWQLAQRKADEQDVSVSAVVVQALTEFGCEHDDSETMLRDEVFVETCSDCGLVLSQHRVTPELRAAAAKGPWPVVK